MIPGWTAALAQRYSPTASLESIATRIFAALDPANPAHRPTTTYYPEEWRVEVTDLKNGGWVGSVEVKQDVYDRCDIGKLWPECWGGRA